MRRFIVLFILALVGYPLPAEGVGHPAKKVKSFPDFHTITAPRESIWIGGNPDTEIRPGGGVVRRPHRSHSTNRDLPDTLYYDFSYGGQFIQYPGDAMLMMYQMPADGYITGVNIPVFEWGTGDQQLTVSLHRVTYPYRSDSTLYPPTVVDGDGWIGGYDMDASGWLTITGTNYTPPGTQGICDPSDYVADGAQDPLGDSLGTGQGVSLMGLMWPDSTVAATLDPANNPAQQDNWLNTDDYGSQPLFQEGEWVGILVAFTGSGGGDDPPVGFYYTDGTGFVDPWVFTKFYAGCGGTSGNGGWHIRHWIIDFELAVVFTSDRPPIFIEAPELLTTLSTADRPISAVVSDDNPSGGLSGVASVTFYYQLDSTTAPLDSVSMTLTSGTPDYGTWTGTMPGQSPETTIYYYTRATDVNGNTTTTPVGVYCIFQPLEPYLIILHQEFTVFPPDPPLPISIDADVWSLSSYGPPDSTMLSYYSVIIEYTGSGPVEILNDVIRPWFEQGGKRYILIGDEWLGVQTGWVNQTYYPGDFQYDILGISADFNDVNYLNAGDQNGISRMVAIQGDSISGELYDYLTTNGLYLNYDPLYELGFNNWVDGVTPVSGAHVAFQVYEGTVAGWSAPDPTTPLYDCGLYYETAYGSKSVFYAFDPLALNADNAAGTGYVWIGMQSFGPLQKAVDWALGIQYPPQTFNLVQPADSTVLVLTSDNLDQSTFFFWQPSTDPNGTPVFYDVVGQGGLVFLSKQHYADSHFFLDHSSLRDSLQQLGLTVAQGSWMVYAYSEGDTIAALNGPFTLTVDASAVLSADTSPLLPETFALHQNYPNPFNPHTTIRYDLPERAQVQLVVYDLLGREVRTLVSELQEPGFKTIVWDGKDAHGQSVGAGVYLYRLQTTEFVKTMKLVVVK